MTDFPDPPLLVWEVLPLGLLFALASPPFAVVEGLAGAASLATPLDMGFCCLFTLPF